MITKAKSATVHNQRTVFSKLQDKEAIKELFGTIGPKIADRPGGYTRVIKTGFRKGDGAEMAMIEFVDFNEVYTNTKEAKKTTRRRRKKSSDKAAAPVAPATNETKSEESTQEEE